jgi:predicted nuclease of restriction endonuclease-like (RecB) superfamily
MEILHNYEALVQAIKQTYQNGQASALHAAQREMVMTYWAIGKHRVEHEQLGNQKSVYGSSILERLSKDLSHQLGRGFDRSRLIYMRLCYVKYPDSNLLSHQLTWSHYTELLKIDHDLERSFYEKQAILEKWTVRELKRQKESALFLRLAASQDKDGVLQLASKGKIVAQPADLLRDPYVFEFLKIPEPFHIAEKELETRLINNMQQFLLELGRGFAFVGRQYGITVNNKRHRIDLVFYHRFLRCFVLVDLKVNEVRHNDIGQMNMYLGYFAKEEYFEGDNPPIGIILTKDKDELLVEYATYGVTSQLFISKYQYYLPNEAELRTKLEAILSLP